MSPQTHRGWALKQQDGTLIWFEKSRRDLEHKVVSTYYNASALDSDPAFRSLFYKQLAENLKAKNSSIVRCEMMLKELPAEN